MRAMIVVLGLLILPAVAAGQRAQTLLAGDIESGGFGGPVLKITQVHGTDALVVGGRGGWIINHTFVLGGGGYGLVTEVEGDTLPDGSTRRIDVGYGGVELEYVHDAFRLVHWSAMLHLGAGAVSYRDDAGGMDLGDGDAFFIAEPGAAVVLNVTEFFRLAAGGGYRLTSGVSLDGLSGEDLDGPSIVIMAKLGSF